MKRPDEADRFRRADAIFDAALDLAVAEQAAFVERACTGDPELCDEVLHLLRAHTDSEGFLDAPALQLAAPLLEAGDVLLPASSPQHVGHFRITGVLGRGGMGEVFLAERSDGQFEQRVALKLIRSSAPGVVQRFLDERRILARLEHPNIARLVDGGLTPEGLPYFAMELVEGEPIDRYCNARQLDIDERLRLFGTVCDAVTYAHRHLVIHRDLKPSNILVTPEGQVKLLDFGIAKLLTTGSDEDATRTQFPAMTPEFAAPEQLRGDAVSTATDVYALGVLLYILLAGERPYDVSGRSAAEVERIVCQGEVPAPSHQAPANLRRRLQGDLDLIVMTALHREIPRRYPSAAELKQDLVRFLEGRPIAARPDSAGYRARKFIARHRVGVSAALVIALLLVAYVTTVVLDRRRVERALAEAQAGTHKAEQVTDFMLGLFQAAEGGRALTDTVTARELLSRGLAEARELGAQPELQAQMLDVIGRLHTQLGDIVTAQPLLEEALGIRRRLYGDVHPDVVTTTGNLADVAQRRQDFTRAIELRRAAFDARRRMAGDDDPRTIDALHALASTLHGAGQATEADPLFDEWLARLAQRPPESTAWRAQQLTAAASLLTYRNDASRAEVMHREALAIRRALYGDGHHLVAMSLIGLGVLLDVTFRREEAEPLLNEAVDILRVAYPDGHPQLGDALKQHGTLLNHLGRFAEAEVPLREALELRRRLLGPNSIGVAAAELDLAWSQLMAGRYEESEAFARDAARIFRTELGPDNSMVFFANAHVGDALRGQRRYREAESMLLAAYARFETPRPITARWRRFTLAALVRLFEAEGRTADAAKYRALLDATVPLPGTTERQ